MSKSKNLYVEVIDFDREKYESEYNEYLDDLKKQYEEEIERIIYAN